MKTIEEQIAELQAMKKLTIEQRKDLAKLKRELKAIQHYIRILFTEITKNN